MQKLQQKNLTAEQGQSQVEQMQRPSKVNKLESQNITLWQEFVISWLVFEPLSGDVLFQQRLPVSKEVGEVRRYRVSH